MNNETLRILACQIDIPDIITAEERDNHIRTSAKKVTDALVETNVDLVVLPELSSISYSRATFEALSDVAESVEGSSFQIWKEVAQKYKVYITYGFARHEGGNNYISTAVISPEGKMLGYYDKIHLA